MPFLSQRDPRPVTVKTSTGEVAAFLFLGPGAMGLEVIVLETPRVPVIVELRQIHAQRTGKRAAPVVLVSLWGTGRAALCSPLGDDTVVHQDLEAKQVERLCDTALSAADRHAAIRFLTTALGQLESPIPGLRNAGLFALHELEAGVPTRGDWPAASSKARGVRTAGGRALIERLGYGIQDLAGPAAVLTAKDTDVAIAVFLEREDDIEPVNPRFDNQSPISFALWKADQKNLDYVVVGAPRTVLQPAGLRVAPNQGSGALPIRCHPKVDRYPRPSPSYPRSSRRTSSKESGTARASTRPTGIRGPPGPSKAT